MMEHFTGLYLHGELEGKIEESWINALHQQHRAALGVLVEGHCPALEFAMGPQPKVLCHARLERRVRTVSGEAADVDALWCPQGHGYWMLCRRHQPACIAWSLDGDFANLLCPGPAAEQLIARAKLVVE